jgi:hypothetical protein
MRKLKFLNLTLITFFNTLLFIFCSIIETEGLKAKILLHVQAHSAIITRHSLNHNCRGTHQGNT